MPKTVNIADYSVCSVDISNLKRASRLLRLG